MKRYKINGETISVRDCNCGNLPCAEAKRASEKTWTHYRGSSLQAVDADGVLFVDFRRVAEIHADN